MDELENAELQSEIQSEAVEPEPEITRSDRPAARLNVRAPITQAMTIKDIVKTHCPPSWEGVFESAKNELNDVSDILAAEEKTHGMFYPLKKDIFRAFWLTPLGKISAVLVGQDPYHGGVPSQPQAVGLSFSVARQAPIPPSLKTMYSELVRTGFTAPSHGDLSDWARRGVLLLNSSLTVRPGTPGSHGQLWFGFVYKVILGICEHNPHCVFILLGKPAQKLQKMLGDRVSIVTSGHPSPLNRFDPFCGSDTFLKVNALLEKSKQQPIDWSLS